MYVLAIETSCDETSSAVVKDGKTVLSNVIASQIELHNKTGGVVPEVASREHIKVIIPVIEESLQIAKKTWKDIDLIAVTKGPGLVGSLLIGVETARALAYSKQKNIVGVNHIIGHIYSIWLDREENVEFPLVILTASGGHNNLVLMKDHFNFEVLGKTRDDASGEAFDKVAKLLGLAYPGGPIISKRAELGNAKKYKFPRAWLDKQAFEFSFSGLKTAVRRKVEETGELNDEIINDICASFQEAVDEVLAKKLLYAANKYNARGIHLTGGVSANKRLRAMIRELSGDLNLKIPLKISYCTDNAAMIGAAGYFQLKKFGADNWQDIEVNPRLRFNS